MTIRLLVVEDEAPIRKFLGISLKASGFEVIDAENADQAIEAVRRFPLDLVILDLGLPDLDGQDVITLLREHSSVPIIVLSARAQEMDKVEALDRGANDYVVKPFGIGELTARIRAVHRVHGAHEATSTLEAGPLFIDFRRRQVLRDGREVRLSKREWELLSVLAAHSGHVLTHQHILKRVWGPAHIHDTAYLRVYINQLRQKLENDPSAPELVLTEPGVGYRLKHGD